MESSAVESVEENDVIASDKLEDVSEKEETLIESNGAYSVVDHVDEKLLVDAKSEGVDGTQSVESVNSVMPKVQLSPGGLTGSSPQANKGYGLKKWRRIRREAIKGGSGNVDSSKIGKRGSNSNTYPRNPMCLSAEKEQKSEEGSVSSTNAVVKSSGIVASGYDSGSEIGPVFAAGTDSENSEDRNSKSSTAASAPRLGYKIPVVGGYAGESNMIRSLDGKVFGNSLAQQGKSWTETSKKPRGDRVKIEKQNSHSSMESDCRSSNFVFMQGANSMTSNGRQSGRSANYDGENSDEDQGGEQHFGKELRTGFQKNLSKCDDVLQDYLATNLTSEIKGENSENHGSAMDGDSLFEPITTLQSAQEVLEKEVLKFMEIGKEDTFLFNNLVHEPSSSELWQFDDCQIDSLKQNVHQLESKLEEARSLLKVKEAKVIELESVVNNNNNNNNNNTSQHEEASGPVDVHQGKYKEMDTKLEGLFMQKIEAEVEYLAISGTIQNLSLEEQKTLASEQVQMMNKLEDAGNKASMLKRRADKLETYCGEIIETDEILKLQKRVCKFTSCFFIQLVLLLVVIRLLVLQLVPHYSDVVPT